MSNFMDQHGEQLRAGGYSIIPIADGSKAPGDWNGLRWRGLKGWTSTRATVDNVKAWSGWPGRGIGILCGPIDKGHGVIAIDLDVDDPAILQELEEWAAESLGKADNCDPPRRVGAPGRSMLVYRIESDVRGPRVGGNHGVEILGSGRQFVAYHVHPTTLQPYEWTNDPLHEVPLSDLTPITQEELDAFLIGVARILGVEPPAQAAALRITSEHPTPTPEAVRSAAASLRNDELDYEAWIQRGLVLRAAYHEAKLSDAEGEQAWNDFSARASKNENKETGKKWRTFQPNAVTASSLFALAQADGWHYLGPFNVEKEAALEHGAEVGNALLANDSKRKAEDAINEALEIAKVAQEELTGDTMLDVIRGHVVKIAPEPEKELLKVEGLVGKIAKWITATAPKPQPWLSIGAAIAVVAALTGRRYAGPTGLRGNLMVLGAAPSGAGKEHPRTAAKEILHAAKLSQYVGGSKIASDQGLLSALQNHAAKLFALDEFGEKLGELLGNRAGSHQRAITSTMTELFTTSASTHEGTDYANASEKPREPLHQPHACFLAMSAGAPLWEALRTGNAVSGFMARWLLFSTETTPPDRWEDDEDVGEVIPTPEIVAGATNTTLGMEGHDYRGPFNPDGGEPWPDSDQSLILAAMDGTGRPVVPRVPWGPGGREEDAKLRERIEWLRGEARSEHAAAVLGRARELSLKVAMVVAVGNDPEHPAITGADLAIARGIVEHCQITMLTALERFVGNSEVEQDAKLVLDRIRRAGKAGISKRDLCRSTQRLGMRRRDAAVAELVYGERILLATRDTGGTKKETRYWPAEQGDAWAACKSAELLGKSPTPGDFAGELRPNGDL